MSNEHSRAACGASSPTCPNCGTTRRHDPTCLLAAQADGLTGNDLAQLATLHDPDGRIERPLHHSEAAMLAAAAGRELSRRERHDIVVTVGPWGRRADAVVRAYFRGSRVVGVMVASTATAEATR